MFEWCLGHWWRTRLNLKVIKKKKSHRKPWRREVLLKNCWKDQKLNLRNGPDFFPQHSYVLLCCLKHEKKASFWWWEFLLWLQSYTDPLGAHVRYIYPPQIQVWWLFHVHKAVKHLSRLGVKMKMFSDPVWSTSIDRADCLSDRLTDSVSVILYPCCSALFKKKLNDSSMCVHFIIRYPFDLCAMGPRRDCAQCGRGMMLKRYLGGQDKHIQIQSEKAILRLLSLGQSRESRLELLIWFWCCVLLKGHRCFKGTTNDIIYTVYLRELKKETNNQIKRQRSLPGSIYFISFWTDSDTYNLLI